MSQAKPSPLIDLAFLPESTGYASTGETLCIGLDVAWFGGSAKDSNSRYDFLAAGILDASGAVTQVASHRVPLLNRDRDAKITSAKLQQVFNGLGQGRRILLAIDAPLQASMRDLPVRAPVPTKGSVQRRACENTLSCKREKIDKAFGGANGWHPNIQPGAPLAPRVQALLDGLSGTLTVWTPDAAHEPRIAIECFPAEAIWAAKRLDWFPQGVTAEMAKAYKKQKGKQLSVQEVRDIVEGILCPFGQVCEGSQWQDRVVRPLLEYILADSGWRKLENYPGGKMLDDVVDSMICLATAVSYASGNAHVWHDRSVPDDGHIIGPGNMNVLLREPTK